MAALEVATGKHAVVLALAVITPLLASSLLGPRATAAYAVLALALGAALGTLSDQYAAPRLPDQVVRLVLIAAGGALAVAAARSRVHREERLARVQRIAAVAQQAILPPVPRRLGDLVLTASYESADEDAAVGGDLYAAVPSPFGTRLLLADVRGHGLDAVRLASTVLGAFRERAHERADLGELARDLDRAVARAAGPEDFVTAVLAELQGDELRVCNAGHPPPLLVRAGRVETLPPPAGALPLGLGSSGSCSRVRLVPGDRLLLYTDGVVEARGPEGDFPLLTAGGRLADGSLEQGLGALRAALHAWSRGSRTDDVTMLAAEFAPPTPA
ncbi:serine phosphatase RsbU (regulator of sigma subunit) [Motilibacter rhizosphaerae]|uniref:Serine phosphatase RsbU (Regulator of sigma subunit) n=1 Tax=Motilibacter rhizosphaerae TaxID=598652 RepID=A0A4Q7NSJ5_9ACTN|nr:PP2C family protein-serine/threonine phosphatase [Motilibacter rhizosphaerae]RZS89934.1 serine phosphatase RsbU (regulator of sigma subunit) [Motilibacter rhizosphaerae]